jgi:hypothetical protein
MEEISRKIAHVKARPTYVNISHLVKLVKKLKNIDTVNLNILNETPNREEIAEFCKQIENLSYDLDLHSPDEVSTNRTFKFKEADFLPKEILSKDHTHTTIELDPDYEPDLEDSEQDIEDSEDDCALDNEDGYELYKSDDDDAEFSE